MLYTKADIDWAKNLHSRYCDDPKCDWDRTFENSYERKAYLYKAHKLLKLGLERDTILNVLDIWQNKEEAECNKGKQGAP
jgi:hypothetical protein